MNTLLRYNLINALLLSVFCHVIIFNTFIFQFPITPEPFKPNIIFLGSILNHNEVFPTTPSVAQLEDKRNFKDPSLINDTLQNRPIITSIAVEKPEREAPSSHKTKEFIKANFLNTISSPAKQNDMDNELPLNPIAQPGHTYKPLRIEGHD